MTYFAIATVAAVLASATLAASIAERNRRSDFVRRIHGANGLSLTMVPTLTVAALGLSTVGLAFIGHFLDLSMGLPIASVAVVADVIVVALLLGVQTRRLRADTLKNS